MKPSALKAKQQQLMAEQKGKPKPLGISTNPNKPKPSSTKPSVPKPLMDQGIQHRQPTKQPKERIKSAGEPSHIF